MAQYRSHDATSDEEQTVPPPHLMSPKMTHKLTINIVDYCSECKFRLLEELFVFKMYIFDAFKLSYSQHCHQRVPCNLIQGSENARLVKKFYKLKTTNFC